MASSSPSLRLAKEQFVSGHQGTSIGMVNALMVSMPIFWFVSNVLGKIWGFDGNGDENRLTWQLVAWEFSTIVMPTLLVYTVWAHVIDLVLAGALLVGCLILASEQASPESALSSARRNQNSSSSSSSFITMIRGEAVLSTALAILAVDFTIFPREFAKAEHYGTGLMDIGVGAFVWTGAMVQKRPAGTGAQSSLKGSVILPLLILGFGRMISTKAVDYQEHTSEYGVHWNFFFTLIMVRVVSDALLFAIASSSGRTSGNSPPLIRGQTILAVGVLLLAMHQFMLSKLDLASIIMDDSPRLQASLMWQNKEGICSALGYAALHLCTQGMAWLVRYPDDWIQAHLAAKPVWVLFLMVDVLLWLILACMQEYVEPVSRRSANASFVLWIGASGTLILTAFTLFEWAITRVRGGVAPRVPVLLRVMSENQLAVFLLANLLTGAVNLSMNTMAATPSRAVGVLSMYSATVCIVAVMLASWRGSRSRKIQ